MTEPLKVTVKAPQACTPVRFFRETPALFF